MNKPYTDNHRYKLVHYTEGDDPSAEKIAIEIHEKELEDDNLEQAATRCAEYHYHVYRDYPEQKWLDGIKITLWQDGQKLGIFTMYLEMTPQFTASRHYGED